MYREDLLYHTSVEHTDVDGPMYIHISSGSCVYLPFCMRGCTVIGSKKCCMLFV